MVDERKMFLNYPQMASVCAPVRCCHPTAEPRLAQGLVIARMPENMFDRSFGLGVEEKVFVLTHLVRVGALLGARPLCKFSVIRAEGCLISRKCCTHHQRH